MREYNPEDTVDFINIDAEDFEYKYGGRPYVIEAGERIRFRLPVAQHFAKHLADKILQREYEKSSAKSRDALKKVRARLWMDPKRVELYAQMVPELADSLMTETTLSAKDLAVSQNIKTDTAQAKPFKDNK